jgi:hypothetical protein
MIKYTYLFLFKIPQLSFQIKVFLVLSLVDEILVIFIEVVINKPVTALILKHK